MGLDRMNLNEREFLWENKNEIWVVANQMKETLSEIFYVVFVCRLKLIFFSIFYLKIYFTAI